MIPRLFPHLCAALLAVLAPVRAGGAEAALDGLVATAGLWTMKPDEFQNAAAGLPFVWTSSARDSARAPGPGLVLFGLPVVEAIARFEGGKLTAVTANFYARGDAGELARANYDALVKASAEAVTKATGVKFTARGKDLANAVKAEGLLWKTDGALFTLEYSATREVKSRDIAFRAEFVRLEVAPPPQGAGRLLTAAPATLPRFNPTPHLQRDVVTGDVWIKDVPMVDQGQKGYCVVASTERVMRYYGADVDANELAQIAKSDVEGGTNYATMMAALKKVAGRLKVRVREVDKMDVKDLVVLIRDYNRAAKRAGVAAIPEPREVIDMGAIFGAMKGAVLREVRTKNRGDLERFQRTLRDQVDRGVPLLWTVHLGLMGETGLRQTGGHMRILIGYNPKTNDVLFTDSWGAGHELKRMSAADAWTITTGLTTIEPM